MDQLDILRVQARRRASELHEAIGLEPSGVVAAVFKNDTYGVFAVEGSVARSTSYFVGGIELGNNGKASRDLVLLVPDDGIERAPGEAIGLDDLPSRISAGDIVRARFEQRPYGTFSVTGVCVASPRSTDYLVGSWFITYEGIAAARLVSIELLARSGTHDIPVPRAMLAWAAENDGSPIDG